MEISSPQALRALYASAHERAVSKELRALDSHCCTFIALSPFIVLSTGDREHRLDASPRGGEPGFVRVDDAGDLLIPDAPGNNRLDSLEKKCPRHRAGRAAVPDSGDRRNAASQRHRQPVPASTTSRRARPNAGRPAW